MKTYSGRIVEIREKTFCAVIGGDNTDEYYELYSHAIKDEDKPFFKEGVKLFVDEKGIRLSHAVWTKEDIEKIKKESENLKKIFNIN